MLHLIPSSLKIDFIGKRKICFAVSGFFLLATIFLLATKGLNWGIDFSGGTLLQIKVEKSVDTADLRSALANAEEKGFSIQEFEAGSAEFLIRLPNKDDAESNATAVHVVDILTPVVGKVDVRRTEFVGPQIGDELRSKGIIGLSLAMLAILIYISVRFEMRYAIGAIVALIHDVVLTVGVFSLLYKEVTMPVLAALLTIIGYSLNDTIVVFDRVRENLRKNKGDMYGTLNLSVNEMLNRTLMTSFTTIVVLVALFALGGGVIHDFAFTLLFGVIVGTYSSVFVASPVVLAMEGYYQRMAEKEKETSDVGFKG